MIAAALEHAVATGQESVKRGPDLLAALRDAGVVDAGGYGLTIMFAGVVAALRGEDPPPLEHHRPARITHPQHSSGHLPLLHELRGHRQRPAAPSASSRALEALGDSVLVVGDENTLKVHLHTDEPERATAVFAGVGEVSHLDVADMRVQVAERDARVAAEPPDAAANGSRTRCAAARRPSGRARAAARRAPRCAAGRSRSSTARAFASCSRSWACTRSTAGRRSTPRPTTCSRACTRCPPRRSCCCRTART